jgi:hypothetical protein
MAIIRCPTCDDAVYIVNNVRVGQIITCDSCEELLKVTSIQPVSLQICDDSQEDEEDCIQVPVRNSTSKTKKKSAKITLTVSEYDEDLDEFQDNRKQDKKKRKPNHQKIELFDE